MMNRIALFALALALPLAACESEPDVIETDTTTIEAPDVDATMDEMGAETDAAMDEMGAETDAAMDDIDAAADGAMDDMDAAADEAAVEVDEAVDGDM
ncbi:hypothetical protein [Rubrivirga sp.]|uniref:hypothetical protein n=1 Tax=Rubrivirga sp. TaxID=1885344 RepID=UPI003B527F8D